MIWKSFVFAFVVKQISIGCLTLSGFNMIWKSFVFVFAVKKISTG